MQRSVLAVVSALFAVGVACAQQDFSAPDTFVEQFDGARTQLDSAEAYIRQDQFAEASELLQKLIDAHGDRIFTLSPTANNRHVTVRSLCNKRISQFPAEGLAAYRKLVDVRAKSLLDQFQTTNDELILQRLVENYPNSSVGDLAIDMAGDKAFAAGRWTKACFHWATILPAEFTDLWVPTATLRTASDTRIVFASPQTPTEKVAAKWILGLILQRENRAADKAAVLFAKKFPKAAGRLGGKAGAFVDLLASIRDSTGRESLPGNDNKWPTFAGNSTRGRNLAKPLEVGDVERNWPLEDSATKASTRNSGLGATDEPARVEDQPVCHPVIDGNQVMVVTDRYLRTFHLDTGKAESWHDFLSDQNQGRGDGGNRPRYTLTLAGDRLFVRTGHESEGIRQHRWMVQMPSVESKIYCFDYKRQRLLWEHNAKELLNNNNYLFEGPPVVDGPNAYVGMTRIDAMSEANVVCLDAQTGKLKWRKVICEAANETNARGSINHNLLTLAEGSLYYCTNLGAIAALEAATGRIQWLVTYARGRRNSPGFSSGFAPDLNPCVYYRGRIFVAPADNLRLLCLHAETGQRLWEAPWSATHILGVGQGNLIVTGQRVWSIDVDTGKMKWYWPQNTAVGYGRGLLAGEFVYWPTKTELHILEMSTGQKARPTVPLSERFRLRGGNLAVAGSNLIIAQSDRIVAMAPYARLNKRIKAELVKNESSAPLHFQLAEAAAGNEDFETAANHYRLALKYAKATDRFEGEVIADVAGPKLFRIHMAAADYWKRQNHPEKAEAYLTDAFETAPAAEKLDAVREIVAYYRKMENVKATGLWLQKVLDEPKLAQARIVADGRTRVSGAQWASDALASLDKLGGESARRDAEAEATRLVERETDADRLLRSADRLVSTQSVPRLVLKAAMTLEKQKRVRDARAAFARLELLASPDSTEKLEAIMGQARCFEQLGHDGFERPLLERARTEFGRRLVPNRDGELTVNQWVQSRLSAIGARGLASETDTATVLNRRVEILGDDRIVLVEGQPPSSDWELYLRSNGGQLIGLDGASGKPLWEFNLGKPARWSQYGPAGLLVGSEDRLACLGYESGNLLWEFALEADGATATGFVRAANAVLVARRGRLMGVHVDNGQLLWEYLPAVGSLAGGIQLLSSWAVIAAGNTIIAIDPATGKAVAELQKTEESQGFAVAVLGNKIVYTPDRSTLVAHDVQSGQQSWSIRLVWPSTEGPKLVADAGRLFLLLDGYELSRLDPANGAELWRCRIAAKPQKFSDDALLVRGNKLFLGSDGWLEARATETGAALWANALPETFGPAAILAAGGKIVFGSSADQEALATVLDEKELKLTQLLRIGGQSRLGGFQAVRRRLAVGRRGLTTILELGTKSSRAATEPENLEGLR